MMAKRRDIEGTIHRAVVDYLRRVLPHSAFIHHSRNEGNRGGKMGAVDGNRGRAMGILAGFPDLILFHGGNVYGIEIKAKGGSMQASQRDVRSRFEAQGIPYQIIRSVDDMREALAEWGIATREKVAVREGVDPMAVHMRGVVS